MPLTPEQQAYKKVLEERLHNPRGNEYVAQAAESWPVQAVLGYGDALSNALEAARVTVASPISKAFTGKEIPYEPIKTGSGGYYDAGNFAGELTPAIAAGMSPIGWTGRAMASTAVGGLTRPSDPMQGAAEGLGYGLAGEALGPVLKGAGKAGKGFLEMATLDDMTKSIANKMSSYYKTAKDSAYAKTAPFFEEFGEKMFAKKGPRGTLAAPTGFKEFNSIYDSNKAIPGMIKPETRQMKAVFEKDPTYNNAKKMVEKLKIDQRSLTKIDPLYSEKRAVYKEMIDSMQNSLLLRMEGAAPGAAGKHKEFLKDYATNVAPFYSDDLIESVAANNPEDLRALLGKIQQESKATIRGPGPNINSEHFLNTKINPELEKAIATSDMFPQWVSSGIPLLRTPGAREKTFKGVSGIESKLTPTMRAWLQSQSLMNSNGEY